MENTDELEIITCHSQAIEMLFKYLKEAIPSTNVSIRNLANGNCLKINNINLSKTLLVNVKLDGHNFDKFICNQEKLDLGIDFDLFYSKIKNRNGLLTLKVKHDCKDSLHIFVDEEHTMNIEKMHLSDFPDNAIQIPQIQFDVIVTMDSHAFHKLCNEMENVSNYMNFECLNDKIIFTCDGVDLNKQIIFKATNNLISINHSHGNPVTGMFELKDLLLLSRLTSLCNTIEIYMKDDFPLCIKYNVVNLGVMHTFFCPIKTN